MTMHTKHPDSHEHGLADGCPRCAKHADDPFLSLDDRNLKALADRTTAWMRDEQFPRSGTEKTAMRNMERALVQHHTLQRIEAARAPTPAEFCVCGHPSADHELSGCGNCKCPSLLTGTFVDVVFDCALGAEDGRFVEVEDVVTGKSMRVGEWVDRGDGYWALRLRLL